MLDKLVNIFFSSVAPRGADRILFEKKEERTNNLASTNYIMSLFEPGCCFYQIQTKRNHNYVEVYN